MENAFYQFSAQKLQQNYNKIHYLFSSKHPLFKIAYSFKTNAHEKALSEIKKLNITAEVVSPFEYQLAKKFEFEKIIYNGVIKDKETIIDCIKNGGKVNIDNEEDLEIALSYFEENKNPLKIGVRLNFEIENGIKSRFGIDVETELFKRIIELDKEKKIIVNGLHCHFTNAKEIETWKNRAEQMKKYSVLFQNLEYVDFGGNMYSMCEKDLMNDYSTIISDCVKNIEKNLNKEIELIIEAGTPLIQDCFDLVSQITHIKDDFIFLDCSKFDLGIHAVSDKTKIVVVKNPKIKDENRTRISTGKIVGYTCMENDVLKKGFSGKFAVGDKMIFKNVGNYSICWANNFICPTLEVIEK